MYEERFMKRAIALSREALNRPGTKPFAAVIVRDGEIIGEGLNHSVAHSDPTSHGEVEAIRDACRRLVTNDLTSAALYSSCEPCSLCVSAIHLCAIAEVYFGTTMKNGGEVLATVREVPFVDPFVLRRDAGLGPAERTTMTSEQYLPDEAAAVLAEWVGVLAQKPD